MPKLRLKTNTDTFPASVEARIQQDGDSLGLLWSVTQQTWVPLVGTDRADRTTAVNSLPAGSSSTHASYVDFDTDYTGTLSIGYADSTVADGPTFETEVRHVRRGEEFDFVIATDRTNQIVPRALTFQLSRRTDSTFSAKKPIAISPKDDFDFAYNVPDLVGTQVSVARIQEIEVTPSGTLTVSEVGSQQGTPILSLDGGQVVGTSYVVSCVVVMTDGNQYECEGTFDCVAS